MSPGASHGLAHFRLIEIGKHLLNAAKFGKGVDPVGTKRFDKLIFLGFADCPCVAHHGR